MPDLSAASSDEEAYSNNSDSSAENESDFDNDYRERRSLQVQSFTEPGMNLASTPVSLEPPAVSDIDDDVQILTAVEAAAEVAAAAREAVDEPNVLRKRKRPIVETKAEPTECTICCENCTIIGDHRLAALKCGHLFGQKCIEGWVSDKHSCPNCSAHTSQTDICLLFSDHVAVVDNSGLEDMTQKFQDEKKRSHELKMQVALLRQKLRVNSLKVEQLYTELTTCKKDYAEMCSKIEQQRHIEALDHQSSQSRGIASSDSCRQPGRAVIGLQGANNPLEDQRGSSQPPAVSLSPQQPPEFGIGLRTAAVCKYQLMCAVPLFNARVFSIARSCRFVCVGDKLPQGSHGLLILSCQDPTQRVRLAVHKSEVRDVCIHSSEEFVLTVAFDGRMAMTSLHDKNVALQLMLPTDRQQGWSCSFSEFDPYAIYCGFQDGSVAKYDYRKPGGGEQGIVKRFLLPERQPVHSIKLFQSLEGMEGLAAATFRGLSVWRNVADVAVETNRSVVGGAKSFAHVPIHQACFSFASDQVHSNQVVLSARSTPMKHSVFDLHSIEIGRLAPKIEFAGHKAPSVLSRSAIWSEADGTSVVASWSHDVGSVTLWDVATRREVIGPELATLNEASTFMPVVDIQHAVARNSWSSGMALLGTMTARQLHVYRSGG